MNVVQTSKPTKIGRGHVASNSKASAVEFYDDIPNCELSLDDFEVFALARLKVRPDSCISHADSNDERGEVKVLHSVSNFHSSPPAGTS